MTAKLTGIEIKPSPFAPYRRVILYSELGVVAVYSQKDTERMTDVIERALTDQYWDMSGEHFQDTLGQLYLLEDLDEDQSES